MPRVEYGYDSDGSNRVEIDIDSVEEPFHYADDGALDYVEVIIPVTGTYRKTYTYTGDSPTGGSRWIKQ